MTATPHQPHIGLVVEGPGDAAALPLLLRSHLQAQEDFRDVLAKPVRCNGRDKATAVNGIEGYVATAAARPGCRGILVVLDAENDASCRLGPSLSVRLQSVGVPVKICLAERTFEDWLFASAETLELSGLTYSAVASGLGAIVAALKPAKYVKPTWQPRLATRVDLDIAASRSPSFARLLDCFDLLLRNCDGT